VRVDHRRSCRELRYLRRDMTKTKPVRKPKTVGTLALTPRADTKGLPRGRASLKEAAVLKAQRERLKAAVIAAVAELGYVDVTISDIVKRARVSRQAFYTQFPSKDACFLAAASGGIKLLMKHMATAEQSGAGQLDFLEAQHRRIRAYLQAAADEPEFTRCLVVETSAAGAKVRAARNAGMRAFAESIAAHHRACLVFHPSWPRLSDSGYLGIVGAIQEFMYQQHSGPGPMKPEELEAPIMELMRALLTR
jgi:AcrR family transcriptional regulator